MPNKLYSRNWKKCLSRGFRSISFPTYDWLCADGSHMLIAHCKQPFSVHK